MVPAESDCVTYFIINANVNVFILTAGSLKI